MEDIYMYQLFYRLINFHPLGGQPNELPLIVLEEQSGPNTGHYCDSGHSGASNIMLERLAKRPDDYIKP